jgi:LacI family transcriptional regulator
VNLGVKVPVYAPDDPQAGRLAAEHLIQRGLENLAFCGTQEAFSRRREAGFVDAAGEEGIEVHTIVPPGGLKRINRAGLLTAEKIRPWLEQLPLPVGILACTDAVAANVLEACRQASLRIPEEVSIVGVDNDEVICDYAQTALTSIDRDMQRVGFEAAGGLDQLMDGRHVDSKEHLTRPKRVVARESTDRLMHRNPQFAQAWQFMRDRCGEPITLEDVLDEVPVSRSTLERSFKQALGRTPGEELRRLRLNRACKLLEETTMPMIEVATHCGMSSLSYFSQAFKKQFEMPPTEYRKRSGL